MHQISSFTTLTKLDITPRRIHPRPIPPFLLPAAHTVFGLIPLDSSLGLGAELRDLGLEVVNLRCAACMCTFEKALVGQEFGGVEGTNMTEGMVKLCVWVSLRLTVGVGCGRKGMNTRDRGKKICTCKKEARKGIVR